MKRFLLTAAAAAASAALLLLGGCATVDEYRNPRVDMPSTRPTLPAPVASLDANASAQAPAAGMAGAPAATGSIYQAAAYRPLFETYRARLPGDTITVQIVEKITATQTSTSSIDKSGKVQAGVTTLPLVGGGGLVGKLGAGGSSTNTFAGKGATQNTNDFAGTVTATVTGVLPNGHLLVVAEKQIGVNANVDVLRFTGQVDPHAIQPGNSVASTQIANVRVEHKSVGQQGDAQLQGVLGRIFSNVLPF